MLLCVGRARLVNTVVVPVLFTGADEIDSPLAQRFTDMLGCTTEVVQQGRGVSDSKGRYVFPSALSGRRPLATADGLCFKHRLQLFSTPCYYSSTVPVPTAAQFK
jgi:hypothetical protein